MIIPTNNSTEEHTSNIFIICPPGLEKILKNELIEKNLIYKLNPFEIIQEDVGGIEIKVPSAEWPYYNYILKSATRILLRVKTFKCRDLPKLFDRSSKINWKEYLAHHRINIESTSHKSRVFDSRKIESAVLEGIELYFRRNVPKDKYIQLKENNSIKDTLFIRFLNDECTISVDTSGELLYKRGLKHTTGKAPIRENMAYALIYQVTKHLKLNTPDHERHLLDPMCGSGTILWEAAHFHHLNIKRKFHFEFFPILQDQLDKIKKTLSAWNEIATLQPSPFQYLSGADLNLNLIEHMNQFDHSRITFQQGDFFNETHPFLKISSKDQKLMIINPPYGKRVQSNNPINHEFYRKIISRAIERFKVEIIGIIIPLDKYKMSQKDLQILQVKKLEEWHFTNGGIPVCFLILQVDLSLKNDPA